MNFDDVIYVICLLVCIGAGNYVKQSKADRLIYTAIGCLMIVIVSGFHSLHCLVSVLLGSAAVLYIPPSSCHKVTFIVMFGYLIFFRLVHFFGLPDPPGHTNMIQMVLTLKVSGIAFEKTAAWKKLQQRERQMAAKTSKEAASTIDEPLVEITDFDVEVQSVTFADIFNYTFNYIGVLTGPYYRYRTYRDYFEYPFRNYAPNILATLEKLKYAAFYCALYLIANSLWPLEYAQSDVFYNERSFFYRLLYVWPTFFIFRMRMYTGLTLSECVCTMAGFGAYPEESDPRNGEGPRLENYSHLKRDAENRKYNFTTIVNTRVKDVETCWTFREGMKHWNICVQYWLAVNVYKLYPVKKYRTAVTFLCSSYWHGFRPGHYFCIMGAPFYVFVEDMWHKLIRKDAIGTQRKIIDVIFWIMKFFGFSYLGTAFLLVSFGEIWKFYSSVYHIGYLTWALMVALGLYLTKQKKAAERRKNRQEEKSSGDTKSTAEASDKVKVN